MRAGRMAEPDGVKFRAQGAGPAVRDFSMSIHTPIGLGEKVRRDSIASLKHVLSSTLTLQKLYEDHPWAGAGAADHQLHLLCIKHHHEQAQVVDALAERIRLLGGTNIAKAADTAELTPAGRPWDPPAGDAPHFSRLLGAHESAIGLARAAAKEADRQGDPGTNALLIGEVLKLNELQVWFLAGHLAGRGSVRSEDGVARNAQPPGRAGKSPATSDTGVATRLKHLS